MGPIKVLALNDDNHGTCFITRGSYYSNAGEFMRECLLKPHTTNYKVAFVPFVDFGIDPVTGESVLPAGIDEDKLMYMFDSLACCYNPAGLLMKDEKKWREREEAFDFFWKYGDKEYFYV